MNRDIMAYAQKQLVSSIITGKVIVETGAYDVNGTVRDWIMSMKPAQYIGMDIMPGPTVDLVADCTSIPLPDGYADLYVSTETFEHVRRVDLAVNEAKRLVKPGGYVLLTAPVPGFAFHEHPEDHWRFTEATWKGLFRGWNRKEMQTLRTAAGIYTMKPYSQSPRIDTSIIPIWNVALEREIAVQDWMKMGMPIRRFVIENLGTEYARAR